MAYRALIKLPHDAPGIMETFPDVRQFPPVQEFKPQFVPEEQLPPLKPFAQLVPQLFPGPQLGYPFPDNV